MPRDQLSFSHGGRVATYGHPVSGEDTHTIAFWAVDEAGNESEVSTVTVKIDATPPTVSLSPSGGTYTDSVSVSWSASDGFSGLASCGLVVNGSRVSSSCSGSYNLGPGSHSVEVRVEDKAGNTASAGPRSYTVVRPAAPRADFTCSPTSGTPPLTISCTDRSTGDITSWSWSFGDGGTSTARNPTHTYTSSGRYTVKLTVRGPGGSDTKEYCCVDVLRTGQVQVTLEWWSTADLDLHVVDPYGCRVYWNNPRCASGGELDVDANSDCESVTTRPVENIYWPAGRAPSGEYIVYVDYWKRCSGASSTESFRVTVIVDGVRREYTGTVGVDDTVLVVRFRR